MTHRAWIHAVDWENWSVGNNLIKYSGVFSFISFSSWNSAVVGSLCGVCEVFFGLNGLTGVMVVHWPPSASVTLQRFVVEGGVSVPRGIYSAAFCSVSSRVLR